MTESSIISTDLVLLDADGGPDKEAVIGRLAALVAASGRADEASALSADTLAREAQSATGLPGGIAIPHCRSSAVREPSIGFARLRPPVDFGAADGPADLVFLIAAPEGGGAEHMKLLTSLARALVRPDFVQSLREAPTAEAVVALVDGVVHPAAAAPAAGAAAAAPGGRSQVKSIIAITAALSDRRLIVARKSAEPRRPREYQARCLRARRTPAFSPKCVRMSA